MGFNRLTSLPVFALMLLFSWSSMRLTIVPSRKANLGTSSPILFLQKPARLLPSTVKYYRFVSLIERCIFTVVRFLIGGMCISYYFYARFFSRVNLSMCEINEEFCISQRVLSTDAFGVGG